LTVYVDTSFLVSVYIADRHSATADKMLLPRPSIFLTPLHLAEWAHAVAQHVFRGQLLRTDADRVECEFEADLKSGPWTQVAMPENVFEVCADLARRHGPRLGIRTLDSLHVAAALQLKAEQFWTFDERQRKLAKAVGLKTA
jgi:predicted nucleic acid-binding protein